MTKTIDDIVHELNEWLDQPAFLNILNESRKEELRIIMHKYFSDKANDIDVLYAEFEKGIEEIISLRSENKELKAKLAFLQN